MFVVVYISGEQIDRVKTEVDCAAEDGFHVNTEADINDITEHPQSSGLHSDKFVKVKAEPDSNDVTEHSENDQTKPYLCTVCDKRFKLKCRLRDHERSHTGDKPFHCTVCEKQFTTKAILVTHKMSHTGVMPYQCPTCSKYFATSSCLNDHKQTHKGGQC